MAVREWIAAVGAKTAYIEVLAFAEFKAKAAEGVGLMCRVVILVLAFGPATMGPCVATIVAPLAFPLDGARRVRILSGNIIGQPSRRGSATFRSSSSPEPLS
jgi:hypothetical protein